ncbi:uncharacterized protein [Procambarus clarkii]|nr:uncharacterized protein LOC123762579 isoform X2 [Procambarus clarkii]
MNTEGVKAASSEKDPLVTNELTTILKALLMTLMPSLTDEEAMMGLGGEARAAGLWSIIWPVIYNLLSIFLLPLVKITIMTLISLTFRTLCIAFFGEHTMAKIVGSEGYIYYAVIMVSNYIGFTPVTRFYTNSLYKLTSF